jgi:hypothetical protein
MSMVVGKYQVADMVGTEYLTWEKRLTMRNSNG